MTTNFLILKKRALARVAMDEAEVPAPSFETPAAQAPQDEGRNNSAERTPEEFYPQESLQLAEVRGLELTLKQALEFKDTTAPLAEAEVRQGLIDVLYGGK